MAIRGIGDFVRAFDLGAKGIARTIIMALDSAQTVCELIFPGFGEGSRSSREEKRNQKDSRSY